MTKTVCGPLWLLFVLFVVVGRRSLCRRNSPSPSTTSPESIDPESAARMDELIRSLQKASGDVVVVATVDTFKPYGDIREYAVKMFENHGRGIGQKGKDNGLLILLAVQDRQVWVEVGYDLEEFITDGYAGELSRKVMVPEFRRGAYGAGLLAGVTRIAGRIAERRNVTLEGAPPPPDERHEDEVGFGATGIVVLIVLLILLNIIGRTRRRRGFWGGSSWSGWNSGVGPFGGGFGAEAVASAAASAGLAAAAAGDLAASAADAAAAVAAAARGKTRTRREGANGMKLMRRTGAAVLVALVATGLSGCSYNRFVGQEEAIKTQWAQVENQLQRRNDLIPNLVETVKGIAQQEKDVFGQIADSRAKLAGARRLSRRSRRQISRAQR